jgi:hypothetical protein
MANQKEAIIKNAEQWLKWLRVKNLSIALNNFFRFEGHTNSIMQLHNNYGNV